MKTIFLSSVILVSSTLLGFNNLNDVTLNTTQEAVDIADTEYLLNVACLISRADRNDRYEELSEFIMNSLITNNSRASYNKKDAIFNVLAKEAGWENYCLWVPGFSSKKRKEPDSDYQTEEFEEKADKLAKKRKLNSNEKIGAQRTLRRSTEEIYDLTDIGGLGNFLNTPADLISCTSQSSASSGTPVATGPLPPNPRLNDQELSSHEDFGNEIDELFNSFK